MQAQPKDPKSPSRAVLELRLRRAAETLLYLLERSGPLRLPRTPKHVGVFLLDSRAMRGLKRKAWGRVPSHAASSAKPVDVLAFPHPRDIPYPQVRDQYLGEVYVNYEAYGAHFDRMLYLLVHGVLHLFGYRHRGKRDTMAMEQMERTLWRHLSLLA